VLELLVVGRRRTRRVVVAEAQDASAQLDAIEAAARDRRVPVTFVSKARLDREARTEGNQGVYATCDPIRSVPLEELVKLERGHPFLLVCDSLTDPRNLGALLRSAECAGVTGVVLPSHRSVRLSPAVTKTAAGAVEHLGFSSVAGIPTALRDLERLGVVTIGLAAEARRSIYDLDVADTAVALVVGGEERGLGRLARERCADVVSIPQHGAIESLNAAVAGAVACFEVARQRGGATRR
jgi:23S rRNA (guanosine2251-2'-O)-methyltransferase